MSGWLGAYVSVPIVLAKLRSASNAALLEMTNREATKTCAVFSSCTIGSVNLTGDTWQSNPAYLRSTPPSLVWITIHDHIWGEGVHNVSAPSKNTCFEPFSVVR